MGKNIKRVGMALIVSGASGTGKSTICKRLMDQFPKLVFSISCTTRPPRPGEVDGVDYYFITQDNFDAKVANNEFIEHATVYENSYGTLREEIIGRINKGEDLFLDIDVQGALQIREFMKHDELLRNSVEFVFIAPPSFEELEKRLRERGTEEEDVIECRLNNAKKELKYWKNYDYLIINDELETAVEDMVKLFESLHKSTKRLVEYE